jgi:hypothetical protein
MSGASSPRGQAWPVAPLREPAWRVDRAPSASGSDIGAACSPRRQVVVVPPGMLLIAVVGLPLAWHSRVAVIAYSGQSADVVGAR